MGLMNFFHNALGAKTQPVKRDYVQRPRSVGQAFGNIGSVEAMMQKKPVVKRGARRI